MEPVITSFEDLKNYANGEVVELPSFAAGQPFMARLRRPSMMALVKKGKIPNALLSSANELFANGVQGVFDPEKEDTLKDMFELFDAICEASFVQPTYQEVKDSGIEMTDEQLMFIFEYSQAGVKALEPFREERKNNKIDRCGEVLQMPSEQSSGD